MRRRYSFATTVVGRSILLREGLSKILRSAHFRVVASVSSSNDLLATKFQKHQRLFLLVHTNDDFDDVVEQIEFLRDRHPRGRIVIVADHHRLEELVSAFRAGANGYFVGETCEVFIRSLDLVMMGETIFPPALMSFLLNSERCEETGPRDEHKHTMVKAAAPISSPLSPRETLILRCLAEGDSNKCIARKIEIAEATVKVHIKAILRKIRVRNRTQAAIWGMSHGWSEEAANTDSPPLAAAMGDLQPDEGIPESDRPISIPPRVGQI
jgi:DNA-binding NarL/FixJ family response regulator